MVQATQSKDIAYVTVAFILTIVSVFIFVGGIPTGTPFLINVDEPTFVERAVRIVSTGDLNPHWFGHPGTITIYLLSALYYLRSMIVHGKIHELLNYYHSHPEPFHRLGKYMIVFFAMFSVFLTWAIAKKLTNRWIALMVSLLLISAPLQINYAALIRSDMNEVVGILLCCIFTMRIAERGKTLEFILAGASLGLAVTAKWPAVVVCLSIVLATGLYFNRVEFWRTPRPYALIFLSAVSSVIATFLIAPYIFLDFGTVLDNVAQERRPYHLGHTASNVADNLWRYIDVLVGQISFLGGALAIVGIFFAVVVRRNRSAIVLVSVFLTYLIFLSMQYLWWERWALPLLPLICVFIGIGLYGILLQMQSRAGKKIALLTAVVLFAPLAAHLSGNLASVVQ
jgi:4-amino-4-deoxy-L-arabinose transferase-like glycosyltransferase